jgi:hypothetical protein
MSTTPTSVAFQQEQTITARLRSFALGALFALVLLVPKLLNIRRDRRSWLAFRVLLAIGGASLVILPLSLWNSWHAAIAGLAMFLAAILLPAAKPETTLADTAAQLGALVIINGGTYQLENGELETAILEGGRLQGGPLEAGRLEDQQAAIARPSAEQLFICSERIWALDSSLHPLLVIPVSQISSATAAESAGDWIVRVRWADHSADFHYRGVFAEHLARVAESTLRSVMHVPLPILPQKRAATA